MKRNRKHWTRADFVVTDTSPDYGGGPGVNREGYCRKCGADMLEFAGDGFIRHYHSHKAYRRKFGCMPLQVA